jgi:hypothetical protein
MLAYWMLFAFFAIGSLFGTVDVRRDKRLGTLAIAWIVLVSMIGLRWHVGADWNTYLDSWHIAGAEDFGSFIWLYERDPGFYGLMWIFREAGLPFWALNLFLAAIFSTGLVAFARTQPSPWFAIAVAVPYLVVVVAMSGVRQATAIGFVLLALVAFQRQQALRFLTYIVLAAAFHASAILVLPLAGFSFARTKFQGSVIFVTLIIATYYSLGSAFVGYSERYLSGSVIKSSGTIVRIGMNLVAAIIFLLYRRWFVIQKSEYLLWRNMSVATIASFLLYFIISSSTALDRLVLYLFPLQIFVFGSIPLIIPRQGDRLIIALLILLYLGLQLFVFLSFGVNREAYLPYQTIL